MRLAALILLLLTLWCAAAWAGDEITVNMNSEELNPTDAVEIEVADTPDDAVEEAAGESVDESSTGEDAATDPEEKRWVYIYEDGCVVGYKVDEEWEFYEVEPKDIHLGNADLMREVSACGSEGGLMLGAAASASNEDQQLRIIGPAPDGPFAAGQWRRRIGRMGDWQELEFDYSNADNHSLSYDRSTMRGNWELDSFTRNGNVWALQSDDDSEATSALSHYYVAGARDRSLTELRYRNGSAEGGSWRASLRHYDTEIGALVPPQPDDSRQTRFELAGRIAECDTTLDAAVIAGSYRSGRATIDNDFTGVRLDGSHWLGPRLELSADGAVTRIDAGLQPASATRSDFSAELGWDMSCDTRLSAFTRGHSDDSDISAGNAVRSWRDTGARLDYRPDGHTELSASLTQRDVELERLFLDNPITSFVKAFSPVSTREDLAGLREQHSADGELLDVSARHRFNPRFYAGASLRRQSFSDLPQVQELLDDDPIPNYFADRREQASLHAAYDLCELGNLTFRADSDHSRNTERESSLRRDQYTLGYSAPICRATRLGLGLTRQSTVIETEGDDDDFDGSGWNYALSLSGTSCRTNYVVSANRATSEAHGGGDLQSLGLELDFDSPWEISAWWREFEGYLGGRSADEVGVKIGYRIKL